MNLDLLKKLCRLANNNPNENEANLAARKAAKMLEENKFAVTTTQESTSKSSVVRNPQEKTYKFTITDEDFQRHPKLRDALRLITEILGPIRNNPYGSNPYYQPSQRQQKSYDDWFKDNNWDFNWGARGSGKTKTQEWQAKEAKEKRESGFKAETAKGETYTGYKGTYYTYDEETKDGESVWDRVNQAQQKAREEAERRAAEIRKEQQDKWDTEYKQRTGPLKYTFKCDICHLETEGIARPILTKDGEKGVCEKCYRINANPES